MKKAPLSDGLSKDSQAWLKLMHAKQAASCANDLHAFVRSAWGLVEPETPFVDNWHIGLICEYLQAVSALEINNLIINLPPRHMKSLLVSVFWPTWSWINAPHLRWLTGSYATPLAVRDALKSRRIIQSSWYQYYFGRSFQLCGDQNLKGRYENDRSGYRLAFSFNSAVTGEGADVLVVDDPLKAQDADSPLQRERVNEVYDHALSTRANDPRAARRVIIMQRLHDDHTPGTCSPSCTWMVLHIMSTCAYRPNMRRGCLCRCARMPIRAV